MGACFMHRRGIQPVEKIYEEWSIIMKEQILEILADIRADIDFESETKLIDDGLLESLDIVAIVGEFNEEFDVEISVEDLVPENFNSVDAMVELITKAQE